MGDLAFAQLFQEHAPRVYAYARRHIAIDSVRTWSPRPSCTPGAAARNSPRSRCRGSW
ncbi:hypothetical protein BN11_2460002 [Nostocoides australiense Ben110]|uniref:Uncharacterized protein n=1 Tax=Nostocoides australiense Ben110 TaxID=1193182 RepID=W6JVY9_9MICO|nr:hypothetical protein BN11_2460002 [Tetrasphaera australiensis Ben110]